MVRKYPLATQPLEVTVTTCDVATDVMVVSGEVHDVLNNFEAMIVEQPTLRSNG